MQSWGEKVMSEFSDKVVLITGASRGIGHAILQSFAKKGAIVIGTATTEASVAKIEETLRKAECQGAGLVMNVTDPDSVTNALATIIADFGQPSILVNNAGITRDNLMLRMKDEEWESVIETDLNSIYRVTKSCLRGMLKMRWGRIISITSIIGCIGNAGQANYAAAKAGIIGFSKSLAQELASRDITVNTIAPGFIETDMTQALDEKQKEYIIQRIPMGRIGSPEDIAATVQFLASEGAGYITGATIHVNGGMYMA